MAIVSLNEMMAGLKTGKRLLGLDLGAKTIGLALSDVLRSIATPMETIRRTKFTKDAEALIAIIEKEDVGALVLGLPFPWMAAKDRAANPRGNLPPTYWRKSTSRLCYGMNAYHPRPWNAYSSAMST